MTLHLTVTSSARNAAAYSGRCVESVRRQTFRSFDHVFIDASSDDATAENAAAAAGSDKRFDIRVSPARLDALRNLLPVWRSLPPDEIVCWVDGDDALLIDRALEHVVDAHERGAWVTWGQFVGTDGLVGFAGPLSPYAPVRVQAWRSTHLKTFRAGLIQSVPDSYFDHHGGAWDQSVMLAAIERAGLDRCAFIPRLLYLYTWEHSAEVNWSTEQKARERTDVAWIRACKPLDRLETAPW